MLPDPERSRALLVGSATYDDVGLVDLPSVAGNIDDFADILTRSDGTGLNPANCVRMLDDREISTIGAALTTVAVEASDMLLVYFAGHGLIGRDGSLYLSLCRALGSI